MKARSTRTPSPATAAAMSAAASSSDTSPGSSRATTISGMPAACSAAISARPITVPFLSTSAAWRMEWTATPPSASAIGTAPNFRCRLRHFFARLLRREAQPRGDLAHDRDRDLGRRDRADRAARSARGCAPRSASVKPCSFKPLEAAGVRLLGAERADIEAVARERVGERRDRRSWDRA